LERFREPAMRRYFIHRSHRIVWSLVFEVGLGRWHIEKADANGAIVRISLSEFERTDHGRQLGKQLSSALHAAEMDA
jgi:hypothetical protein